MVWYGTVGYAGYGLPTCVYFAFGCRRYWAAMCSLTPRDLPPTSKLKPVTEATEQISASGFGALSFLSRVPYNFGGLKRDPNSLDLL